MEEEKEVVIITGSSGRIGSALSDRLAGRYRIVGFDHGEPTCPVSTTDCLSVDVSNDSSVADALAQVRSRYGARLASVIHLAAFYSFSGEPDPRYEAVNVRGTERLLRGLQSFEVEQFVFSSTMLVHAPCEPGQQLTEESPLEPRWPYPQSKADCEALIRAQRGAIPVVLARIAAVYDERCRLIPLSRHMQRLYERQLVGRFFPGDSDRGMTYLHFDDLLDALVRIVDRRKSLPPELPLLLGEPEPVSYAELQRELSLLLHGEEIPAHFVPPAVAKAGAWLQERLPGVEDPFIKPWMIDFADDHYAYDISRARTLLDWEPRHSLRQSLPALAAALKEDPRGWYEDNGLELPDGGAEPARAA